MQNIKTKIKKDINLRQYISLVDKIIKTEYNAMNLQHIIDYDELINIGLQTINTLHEQNSLDEFNESYLSTAIKWAVRNELRSRYRWYGVRESQQLTEDEHNELREIIYTTVLSTDELFDNERTFEVRDTKKNPEESCEFSTLSEVIKTAVMTLPKRERDLIESKFFKEKKLHELSDEFLISTSRISRIIKSGLKKIRDELIKNEVI